MKETNMHHYNGIDYRYASSDLDKERAAAIIANILGFAPEMQELEYSLNFYAGSIGVDNKLAIRYEFSTTGWALVVGKLNLKSPLAVLSNPEWGEGFAWLVGNEEILSDISRECCDFVNEKKQSFQDIVTQDHVLLFNAESNVNAWSVVWVVGDKLNYLGFDQG